MPIYEYQCQDCGHNMEALQKIADAPLVDCPACGKPGLKKQVTAAAFKLTGTGWYETDFKNSGKKEPATKSDTAASSKEKSGESSTSGNKASSAN